MALLILIAMLWVVVLTPSFLKRRTERQSVGSIDHFHHQLHLLERAGPKIVNPAYRLQSAESATGMAVGASGFPAISSMPHRPNLVLLKPVGEGETTDAADDVVDGEGSHYLRLGSPMELGLVPDAAAEDEGAHRTIRMADPERYRRQQVRRRRRDILGLLLGTTVFTGLLGIVPSLHLLWSLTVVGGVALAGYVGLAMYALQTPQGSSRPGRVRGAGAAGHGRHAPARRPGHAASRGGAGWTTSVGWDVDPAQRVEAYGYDDEDDFGYGEPPQRVASN